MKVKNVSLDDVGLSKAALDVDADPCEDFYQFACGTWMETTEIPEDNSRWVRSFSEIYKANETYLKRVLEEAAANADAPDTSPELRRLGRFYGACMDEEAIEKAGLEPVLPLLKSARNLDSAEDVQTLVADLHARGIWVFWSLGAVQDFKDATQNIAYLGQAGTGLPERGYYFDEDKAEIREAYLQHIERMLSLAGEKSAARKAAEVMQIETQLAENSLTRVERRNPYNLYHKIDRSGVIETAPVFDWASYFTQLSRSDLEAINVTHIPFLERVNEVLKERSPESLRSYFVWHILRSTAPTLSRAFDQESFSFQQVLSGAPEQRERWKRCITATDQAMGETLGQPFVEARFAGESKSAAESYVKAISRAFRANLDELAWMDAESRAQAEQKLDAMAFLIGYPSKWEAYAFEITDNYAENALAAAVEARQKDLARIGEPVDRERWFMTPPTVNAYYSPTRNQMVFPAGILQPPFYSVDAAIPVNLGAMGFVVGHELTHGFDDQGGKFDADGNLRTWWSEDVASAFEARTQCIADKYAGYEPIEGQNVNGKLTLGENIADLGGLKLAFAAYRSLMSESDPPVVADGFDEDQQFFLAAGQVWCTNIREAEAKLRLQTDPHSPPRYRVNGPLSNLPAFAEAFNCPVGTPMNPDQMCSVW